MEDIEEESKISHGFDRGVDYDVMKDKFINCINKLKEKIDKDNKPIDIKRLVYCTLASIQLANGSRISEAVRAFVIFLKRGIGKRVEVKISKSGAIKVMKDGNKKKTKVRYREMQWAPWITDDVYQIMKDNEIVEAMIEAGTLKKRTLDFLLINFECNTHSLRYAFVNHALYVWKRPISDVAKFVGHANTAQMVTYTQLKNSNQMFDLVKDEDKK